MVDLFPFVQATSQPVQTTLDMFQDVAWNYERDEPIIKNGDFMIVEGDEALRVWIYKAIKTKRYAHMVYTDDYGCEINTLVGKGYTKGYSESEAIRFVKDAILVNPYILGINKISASYTKDNLTVTASIKTMYSDELEVEYNV